jgi:hypothetical protein
MLQVARLAPNLLHEAGEKVVDFLQGELNDDGGYKDRSGQSDLYYTVFGLEGMTAMQAELPVDRVGEYLRGFGDGADLDLVHLACLARCWANLGRGVLEVETGRRILERIEGHRSEDGGYGASLGGGSDGGVRGTAYHSFLAFGAYQDLRETVPDGERLASCLSRLRSKDGAFGNEAGMAMGTTPTTAAVVTLMRQLGAAVPGELGDWLLARCHPAGGFLAMPEAPMPDLLSTATALHALAGMQVSFEGVKESCLDFVDSLWTGKAFCGSWADDAQDCEYTYYALLALGHLSL